MSYVPTSRRTSHVNRQSEYSLRQSTTEPDTPLIAISLSLRFVKAPIEMNGPQVQLDTMVSSFLTSQHEYIHFFPKSQHRILM